VQKCGVEKSANIVREVGRGEEAWLHAVRMYTYGLLWVNSALQGELGLPSRRRPSSRILITFYNTKIFGNLLIQARLSSF